MNQDLLDLGIFCVIIVAVIVLASYYDTYQHEQAHKAVYAKYGVDSQIDMKVIGTSTTTALNYTEAGLSEAEDLQIRLAQNVVEAVGYQTGHLFVILCVIAVCAIVIAMSLILRA